MGKPTITIVTGLPNSGQEEYCKNLAGEKFKIPNAPFMAEYMKQGKDIILCDICDFNFIKYETRNNFFSDIIRYYGSNNFKRKIVICTRPYLIHYDQFKLLYNFEFPITSEGFEILIHSDGKDNIFYKPHHKRNYKIQKYMKRLNNSKGYHAAALNFDIGVEYVSANGDIHSHGNVGAYIAASNINTIKLDADPTTDYQEKLNMIFLINYQNYIDKMGMSSFILHFSDTEARALLDLDTCKRIQMNKS